MVGIVAKGLQDGLGDFADTWEMFQKFVPSHSFLSTSGLTRFGHILSALNPPAYYPPSYARLKLCAVLLPLAIIFAITPPAVFAHAGSFALGAGFFGAKYIMQGTQWAMKKFPNWQEQLDLSNSLLTGVPTHAQLTLVRLLLPGSCYLFQA